MSRFLVLVAWVRPQVPGGLHGFWPVCIALRSVWLDHSDNLYENTLEHFCPFREKE